MRKAERAWLHASPIEEAKAKMIGLARHRIDRHWDLREVLEELFDTAVELGKHIRQEEIDER